MKPLAAIFAAAVLAACAAPVPPPQRLYCPVVPPCTRQDMPVTTNGELAAAYVQRDAELRQCTLARDTLQACLDAQHD